MNQFKDIAIGEEFDANGNVWRKRSSRTAALVLCRGYTGSRWFLFTPENEGDWFWFGLDERVNSERHWWECMRRDAERTQALCDEGINALEVAA